jgi:di/tricarboxylate transporter
MSAFLLWVQFDGRVPKGMGGKHLDSILHAAADAAVNKTPRIIWREHLDDASEMPYYHNEETGETTWDKPTELFHPHLLANNMYGAKDDADSTTPAREISSADLSSGEEGGQRRNDDEEKEANEEDGGEDAFAEYGSYPEMDDVPSVSNPIYLDSFGGMWKQAMEANPMLSASTDGDEPERTGSDEPESQSMLSNPMRSAPPSSSSSSSSPSSASDDAAPKESGERPLLELHKHSQAWGGEDKNARVSDYAAEQRKSYDYRRQKITRRIKKFLGGNRLGLALSVFVTAAFSYFAAIDSLGESPWDALITLVITMCSLLMMMRGSRPDVTMCCASVMLVLCGVIETKEAVAAFSNPDVLAMGTLLIVAKALDLCGIVELTVHQVLGKPRNVSDAIFRVSCFTVVMSAFMSNTPLVAILVPILESWGTRALIPPSKLLMPLSFSAMLGGVLTLIGSSTNLVVQGLAYKDGFEKAVGSFTTMSVAAPTCVVGVATMLATSFLLPSRGLTKQLDEDEEANEDSLRYKIRVYCRKHMQGKSPAEMGLTSLPGVRLRCYVPGGGMGSLDEAAQARTKDGPFNSSAITSFAYERHSTLRAMMGRSAEMLCNEGDALEFSASADAIPLLRKEHSVALGHEEAVRLVLPGRSHRRLYEMPLTANSVLIGKTGPELLNACLDFYNAVPICYRSGHGQRIVEQPAAGRPSRAGRKRLSQLFIGLESSKHTDDGAQKKQEGRGSQRGSFLSRFSMFGGVGGGDDESPSGEGTEQRRKSKRRTNVMRSILGVGNEAKANDDESMKLETLEPGDMIILEAGTQFSAHWAEKGHFALIREIRDSAAPRRFSKADKFRMWFTVTVVLIMIVVAAADIASIFIASCVASFILIALGSLSVDEAFAAVDAKLLLSVAATFGIATAMDNSGVSKLCAQGLGNTVADLGPIGALTLVFFVATFMTNFLQNNATAILLWPVVRDVAEQRNFDPSIRKFAVVLLLGASFSFGTPVGYQTNLMVYNPGHYESRDFIKFGGALHVVTCCVVGGFAYYFL